MTPPGLADLGCEWVRCNTLSVPSMFVASLLIYVFGLAAFSVRMLPQLRARLRARRNVRMMACRIRIAVQRQNLRQVIAGLRAKQENEVQPVESRTTNATELHTRIEQIRLRSISYRNRQKVGSGVAGLTLEPIGNWFRLRVMPRFYNVVRSTATLI